MCFRYDLMQYQPLVESSQGFSCPGFVFVFFIGVFVVVVVVLLVCLFFTAESILTKWSLNSNCHLSQNTFIQHSWRNKMYFYSVAMHASFSSSSSSFLFSSALASKINNFSPICLNSSLRLSLLVKDYSRGNGSGKNVARVICERGKI